MSKIVKFLHFCLNFKPYDLSKRFETKFEERVLLNYCPYTFFFSFTGMIDSNWTVGAVLEKKLAPLPFTLNLSGMINHTKGQSHFGIGLIIGG